MTQKTDKSLEIMGEVMTTATIIGPVKTKRALINARREAQRELEKNVENLVKKKICEEFGITEHILLNGASKGPRTNALMVGYVLIKRHLSYRLIEIAKLFKKDESNVSKSITAFNYLQATNKQHKALLDVYEKLSCIVIEYKTNNTWQAEKEVEPS